MPDTHDDLQKKRSQQIADFGDQLFINGTAVAKANGFQPLEIPYVFLAAIVQSLRVIGKQTKQPIDKQKIAQGVVDSMILTLEANGFRVTQDPSRPSHEHKGLIIGVTGG